MPHVCQEQSNGLTKLNNSGGFKRLDEFQSLPVLYCESSRKTNLYVLTDPRDQTVRYIGVSIAPAARLRGHMKHPARCVAGWISELKGLGLVPGLVVIGEVCKDNWQIAERAWIRFFRIRAELLNEHHGGVWKGNGKLGGIPRFTGKPEPEATLPRRKKVKVNKRRMKAKKRKLAMREARRNEVKMVTLTPEKRKLQEAARQNQARVIVRGTGRKLK